MKTLFIDHRFILAALTVFISGILSSCIPGGSDSSNDGPANWYYHWNCNGDSECIAFNPTGETSGSLNEGPVYANCSSLLTFAEINWNMPPATSWCDRSATIAVPNITRFTPTSGSPGTTVTLTGKNLADATVTINGTSLPIISNTNTQIIISIGFMAPYIGPFTINTPLGSVYSDNFSISALSNDRIYWTASNSGLISAAEGGVKTIAKSGGSIATLKSNTTSPISTPSRITADANYVYWTEFKSSGTVNKVSKTTGIVTPLISGLHYPYGIAVDSTYVYWTEDNNFPVTGLYGAKISKIAIAGGAQTVITSRSSGLSCPACPTPAPAYYGIALDATYVYWAENNPGKVFKAGVNGGGLATLASITPNTAGSEIALDATNVYWIDATAIRYVAIGGGAFGTVATTSTAPVEIAIDASHMYWTEGTTVKKTPLSGGAITTLVSGLTSPQSIAVDATNVYWIDGINLWKVAKGGGSATILANTAYGADDINIDLP